MLTVIGLGNTLRGDDAIGPHIIEKLHANDQKDFIHLVDAGIDAFTVLNHLIEDGDVLLIDSARLNRKPGSFQKIKVDNDNMIWIANHLSLHGLGFAEMYRLAKLINPAATCTLIAVEPKEIDFNSGLSEEVQNSVPGILKMISEEFKKYAKEKNIDN